MTIVHRAVVISLLVVTASCQNTKRDVADQSKPEPTTMTAEYGPAERAWPAKQEDVGYEAEYLQIGTKAAEIIGENVEGKPIKLSDFKGQVVVLDFWGFW